MSYNERMINFVKTVLIVFILCYAQSSWAILHLKLTQGVKAEIPVLLQSFSGDTTADTLTSMIKQDLRASGQINLKSERAQSSQAVNSQAIKQWRQQRVNYAITGSAQLKPDNNYLVQINLYDVYKQNAKPVLQQQFSVAANKINVLAHHLSDLIYRQITGSRGIFNTKIAYVLAQFKPKPQYKLIIADYDGENALPVLVSNQPIVTPSWSPNGNQLTYVSYESGYPAIYISNINTGKRRLITKFPGINAAPVFSPNGKKLALVLSRNNGSAIYTVNLANGQLNKIIQTNGLNTGPSWSRDSRSIVFTSDRSGSPQVYSVNVMSHGLKRLTFQGDYNADAELTPDGKNIIYLHHGNDTQNRFAIVKQNLAQGNLMVLAQTAVQSPNVAPNGSMVIYIVQSSAGDSRLAMVSSDGNVQFELPSEQGIVETPVWSPFLPLGSLT